MGCCTSAHRWLTSPWSVWAVAHQFTGGPLYHSQAENRSGGRRHLVCGGFSDQFFLGSCVIGDEAFLPEVGLLAGTGFDVAGTGSDVGGIDSDVAGTGFDVADTGFDVADTGFDVAGTGFDVAGRGFDVAGGWPEGPGPESGASGGMPCSSELLCVD